MTKQRDPGEVFEAYAALNDKERRVLLGIACHYVGGTGYGEPLDLLHEALIRTADGRRKWSVGVDFGAHMALAMRSIADGDRKLHANLLAAGAAFDELMEWAADSIGSHASAEAECLQAQERAALRRMAARADAEWTKSGDWEACAVMEGIFADLDDSEIAERLGLTRSAARSAKKRVLRKLGNLARL
jgi:DNA-directed RNA polymerase specialized sigma24 family protein